jgi:multidrug efflux system outer membrane protein
LRQSLKFMRTVPLLAVAALFALPASGNAAPAVPPGDLAAGGSAAAPLPPARWWQAFADPGLDRLMAQLDRDNTAIAAAAARLAGARAHAALGRAETGPQLGLSTSGNYAAGPLINAAGGSGALFTGALVAAWEPDVLGRFAPSRRADKAEIRAAEADQSATRLIVEVHAARAWFAAIALGDARSHAVEVLSLTRECEAIAQARFARGLGARQALDSRASDVAAARDRLAALTRSEAEARDAIGYLAGDRTAFAPRTSQLPDLPPVLAGLDAGLIERRPDVAAAIARVEAADARHSAARRAWLPRFGLTATGGTASTALTSLLASGAGSFGLGLLAALPVFGGGAHKARVAGTDAARQLAAAQLRDTVLTAYRETGDALAGIAQTRSVLGSEIARNEITATAEARARRAAERGSMSRSAMIEARITEQEAEAARSLRELDAIEAQLSLLMALGGDWGH